ncbi:glycine receptor subunit alpha-1-like [Tubulanus polymorphus]|uniref:glycine receptor subunit alpha-1-like n=1 Tax=Tubulanus polymorphus TaxID=672921 RepID=UPI003DA51246
MKVDAVILLVLITNLLLLMVEPYSKNNHTEKTNRLLSQSAFMDNLLTNYLRMSPPRLDQATNVKLGIYVNGFDSISEQSMDYAINIYLREEWVDPRLSFKPFNGRTERQMIKLGDGMWEKIWVPDVFFRNEKKAQFHYITLPNRLLRLYSDGTVYYASKVTAVLSCPMKLHKYPLDTQVCPMMIESFGSTTDVVTYEWRHKPVAMEPNLQLPQFNLIKTVLEDCSQNYTTGSYPCLQVNFTLKRSIGYYMIQIYIPSVLIVILSWVAFWISIDAIPARVTIGLLTVLTMTTQSTGARESLPRVSYIKALDVWMSVCLIFVFSSLLEFAVVNVYSRKESSKRHHPVKPHLTGFNDDERIMEKVTNHCAVRMMGDASLRTPGGMGVLMDHESRQRARTIDKLSRKLFPLAFLLFNVVYWVAYILW